MYLEFLSNKWNAIEWMKNNVMDVVWVELCENIDLMQSQPKTTYLFQYPKIHIIPNFLFLRYMH